MPKIIRVSPTKIRLEGFDFNEVHRLLAYKDSKVSYELQKHLNAQWFVNKFGEAAWNKKAADLRQQENKNLLFQDKQGYWTYSGLIDFLQSRIPCEVEDRVEYPEAEGMAWDHSPKKPRPYQTAMVEALIAAKHGGVEAATGVGKSLTELMLVHHYGLQTVILTPSISIATQMYDECVYLFGKKYVGMYGDGKKEFNKRITVAIAASLTRLEPGDEAYKKLSKSQVFVGDEAHLLPASTLAKVCFGLLADVPYRFFFSATQMRGDGLGKLLDGIIGKIVYKMSVKEGVDGGYLAKPYFKVVNMMSKVSVPSGDPLKETRAHLYFNPEVNKYAAELANKFVENNSRVVILIEEIEQFTHLLPFLKHEVRFAHGGASGESLDSIPEKYRKKPDTKALVKAFDNGEYPILVGTSCIGTGTDIKTVNAIIYLQGGKSEVQIKQAIGRGTRRPPGKECFYFIDFDIYNNKACSRHADARREYYRELYPDSIEEIWTTPRRY